MDLSIIIVNYNHKHLIQKCIETIIASKPSMKYEIIVVDNGSDYDVKSQISAFKRLGEDIHLIKNKENVGFGRANNQGVEKARGTWVLFLNTDIEVLDRAIDELYSFANHRNNHSIAGGKLINVDGSDQKSAGAYFTIWNTFALLFLKGDRLGLTRYSPPIPRQVDWLSGACFMIKKSDFKSIGGFDEGIFMYMEEVDLMYRAHMNGIITWFCPAARFIHIGAATSGRNKSIINIYRGLIYFYSKHFPDKLPKLRFLLATKAHVSVILGKVTGNTYLVTTYDQASDIIKR